MADTKRVIVGIHVHDRLAQVPDIQKTFSDFGCNIKTRLGLHDADTDHCAVTGLILLETAGELNRVDELVAALGSHQGISVQKMEFCSE